MYQCGMTCAGECSGEVEAVAVDDVHGTIFYSDEACCLRTYAADPDASDTLTASDPNQQLASFGYDGFVRDREGISIYRPVPVLAAVSGGWGGYASDGRGLLIVSDQQAPGEFRTFCR